MKGLRISTGLRSPDFVGGKSRQVALKRGDLRADLTLPRRDVLVGRLAMAKPEARLTTPVRASDRVVAVGKEFTQALLASHEAGSSRYVGDGNS